MVAHIRDLGVQCDAFQADLGNGQAILSLFSQVSKQFRNLHSLVNSASIFEYDRANSSTPLSGKSLAAHMSVNLTAPVLLVQLMFEFHKNKNDQLNGLLESVPSVLQLLDQKLINLNPDFCCTLYRRQP